MPSFLKIDLRLFNIDAITVLDPNVPICRDLALNKSLSKNLIKSLTVAVMLYTSSPREPASMQHLV